MNPRTWRITSWWGKLIFAFGALFIGGPLLGRLLDVLGVAALLSFLILGIFDVGILLLGARIFRGKYEPVAPARPWWQMTARKKLSSNLGSWLAVVTALMAVGLVLSFFTTIGYSPLQTAIVVLYFGIPAHLYLNSAARLEPEPKPEQLPTQMIF